MVIHEQEWVIAVALIVPGIEGEIVVIPRTKAPGWLREVELLRRPLRGLRWACWIWMMERQ
jgi:hypothetical protein